MRCNPLTQLSLSSYFWLCESGARKKKKVVNSVILSTPFRLNPLTSWSCRFQIYSDGVSNICVHTTPTCAFVLERLLKSKYKKPPKQNSKQRVWSSGQQHTAAHRVSKHSCLLQLQLTVHFASATAPSQQLHVSYLRSKVTSGFLEVFVFSKQVKRWQQKRTEKKGV